MFTSELRTLLLSSQCHRCAQALTSSVAFYYAIDVLRMRSKGMDAPVSTVEGAHCHLDHHHAWLPVRRLSHQP